MTNSKGKIRKLENEFTKKREIEIMKNKISVKLSAKRKRRAMFIVGLFMLCVCVFGVQIIRAKSNLAQINDQIVKQKADLKTEKATNKKLSVKVKQLNNRSYVEKLIRERYYYTKPGETVYSFPDKAIDDLD
ncbi:septum formation initiator [Lentilactobacillus curieae]|uniref:Septum formation initiator n=1 Tax=Lentilactobacillus curieae TaxID=1138822 RepID=A0A1S6QJC8_9LACO|nr:septum formation initiator family protein [Lentilactobacillus curieae]AQW21737.1 septum formation initiator [Lentilactobacillus curieae]